MRQSDEHKAWLAHPLTRELQRKLVERQEETLTVLLGVCRASTDPTVTAWVNKYDQAHQVIEDMHEGDKDE